MVPEYQSAKVGRQPIVDGAERNEGLPVGSPSPVIAQAKLRV
jgi:hypothetical protein